MIKFLSVLCLLLSLTQPLEAKLLGRIVAVVEEDVILDAELEQELKAVSGKLSATNVNLPPEYVLRRQVLERMIVDKLQRQQATKSGIQVSEESLRNAINEIAMRNNMNDEQFREELNKQGLNYKSFEDNVRNEIIVNQLKAREIGSKIKVTDAEVTHYLETEGKSGQVGGKYRIAHILIAVPNQASAAEIKKAQTKADKTMAELRSGKDFKQVALSMSDDSNALKGGDLGWRTMNEIPSMFASEVAKMKPSDISEPIRSPSGFHIIKMLDSEGGSQPHSVTKTKVRHILVKTNELVDDNEAKKRLLGLKQRIADGDDFATLARAHSDDKSSALNGGSLDWVTPGALVPPFEEAMNKLPPNAISDPIQTQFGWHLIQVLERQNQDNSAEFRKDRIKDEIRKRKIEEETELWLRRLRSEAYVEITPQ